jgi:hypothetical protein
MAQKENSQRIPRKSAGVPRSAIHCHSVPRAALCDKWHARVSKPAQSNLTTDRADDADQTKVG